MKTVIGLGLVGVFASGLAFAAELSLTKTHGWYCVSESPSGMQSSGHIGYGHGKTRAESARKAVDACRLDGGHYTTWRCVNGQWR